MMLFDPVQTQKDLVGLLLSYVPLNEVSIIHYRKLREAQEIDFATMLTVPRNTKVGGAIVVAEPTARSQSPNVSGPILIWSFPVIAFEQPDISMNPSSGTGLSAEQMAQHTLSCLHLYADDKLGTLTIENPAITPEREFAYPGVIGYRTTFMLQGKALQNTRVGAISITIEGSPVTGMVGTAGTVALSCATAGATICYTLDGSFPANVAGQGTVYATPFEVTAGQVLRVVAYKANMGNSAARYVNIS